MVDYEDSSDEEQESVLRALALAVGYYSGRHLCKEPCRTSVLSGAAWTAELEEGNPVRIFENLRMPKSVFRSLCSIVDRDTPPSPWAGVETNEKVAMFLYCVSRSASNSELQERFQHSGETVHRHFHAALDVICSLAPSQIVQPSTPSTELTQNPKFAEHFARCRLAFDGTHIPAFVPDENAKPYRDRSGGLSQNVFAACTFDMYFAFVVAGWEGSAADSTVLADARRKGFSTPPGLFDLGDAGYHLSMEVLTPHRGVRYHLREWGQAKERHQNYKELYNLRHAPARNVIERAFGVLKRRFPILMRAPEYSVATQANIVVACCVLHNFIRRQNDREDDPEEELELDDEDQSFQTTEDRNTSTSRHASYAAAAEFRDSLAKAMWDSYASNYP